MAMSSDSRSAGQSSTVGGDLSFSQQVFCAIYGELLCRFDEVGLRLPRKRSSLSSDGGDPENCYWSDLVAALDRAQERLWRLMSETPQVPR